MSSPGERHAVVALAISERALDQCPMDISLLASRHLPAALMPFVATLEERASSPPASSPAHA